MKFDFVIGNPPYQESSEGKKKADNSVYHFFMDAAYEVGDRCELITPARFLFNNGNTPVKWNEKMLHNQHFKVQHYEKNSSNIFANTDIKGGIVIHYYNKEANFGVIEQFTEYKELNTLLKKVSSFNEASIMDIIFNQNKFNLENLYIDFPELKTKISSDGTEKRLTSGCLSYDCFTDHETTNNDVQIIGLVKSKRSFKFINKKYIDLAHPNFEKYKVILPANNGSGAIGEVISTPLIGTPLIGYTQTFISFGAFDTLTEADNCMKYIKSRFARTLLGVLKITQNGKKPMWKYVPTQNFTETSDINWNTTIKNIDQQLYKKYGLTEEEIDFIETYVKEME